MDEDYFVWNGLHSQFMGFNDIRISAIPTAKRRGTNISIPGRDGTLFLPSDAYDGGEITIKSSCTESCDGLDKYLDMMGGQIGILRLSTLPYKALKARLKQTETGQHSITLHFDIMPYAYKWPQRHEIILTAAATIKNTGTMAAEPRIKIEATGDCSLQINDQTITITGEGAIIDTETMEITGIDGLEPAYNRVMMDE